MQEKYTKPHTPIKGSKISVLTENTALASVCCVQNNWIKANKIAPSDAEQKQGLNFKFPKTEDITKKKIKKC